ncbi:MAG: helix-turn-helix domain-containing protein [Spiribacter salinus]|uniref:Helix-turn-helix domain-containing protein n=1 Tax=Spiribacter salinus TaxID=1335746 RepID=A0A540V7H0_9GAMM|nr:MAG: helix-turn-helix domain-containing protein [Spiribacter salinus]
MNSPEPLAYTINGACEALGIGRTRIYDEIKAGRLRAIKYGKRTLIRRQDAEAWLERLSREQEAAA